MNDYDVLDFCRTGYLMLEGVVPDEVNARVMDYCDDHAGARGEISVGEPWYVSAVTLNPTVIGVIRSLLGKDFAYVDRAATHRSEGAQPAQRWHRDGGAVHGPRVDCLQVFYLPQETTLEMGPTEVLPGSHHLFQLHQYMAHYARIRGYRPCGRAGRLDLRHALCDLAPPLPVNFTAGAQPAEVLVPADDVASA